MSTPPVSVIIVCRNPGPLLRTALGSVWAQQGGACEVVVIDGASTDGSREWIESQRARIGTLVSEPDDGVYAAMNKGVAVARGDWLIFLGSDDRLLEDALSRIAPVLQQTGAGVLVGEAKYDDGRIYCLGGTAAAARRNFVHHQAAFYRRTLFAAHGKFDEHLQLQADYDFNLRLLRSGVLFAALAEPVACCGSGGLSDSGSWLNYREEITVRHRHFPGWQCWLWDLGSVIRFLRKKLIHSLSSHG